MLPPWQTMPRPAPLSSTTVAATRSASTRWSGFRFDAGYFDNFGRNHMFEHAILFDPDDYSVVVKLRAPPPNSWRWEIYRAGRTSPIEHASDYFYTMTAASRAGKLALKRMLDTLHSKKDARA